MRRRGERGGFSAMGVCSLITIFTVLCMCIFAALTISSVQEDCRLAERSNEMILMQYEADCLGEEILADLRQGIVPEGVECLSGKEDDFTGEKVYAYSCPISDGQRLVIKVRVQKENYEVLQWKSVSTVQWESDETLNLWDGE